MGPEVTFEIRIITHVKKGLSMLKRALYVVCLAAAALSANAEIEKVMVPETKIPPKINGTLDDACWKSAFTAKEMNMLGRRAGEVSADTQFYLCHDNAWLYFGIRAYNKNMPQVIASIQEDNKRFFCAL